MAATAALAAFVSAAVTWGLSLPSRPPHQAVAAPSAPAPRAAVVLASLTPVNASPPISEEPTPVPRTSQPARPRLAKVHASPPRSKPAPANPCYALPTAAERLVCGYPGLAAQDRELRAAYDRAKAAGVDARTLDSAQANWRSASDHVSDRNVLATLYDRRIQELETAARAAKAQDPPF